MASLPNVGENKTPVWRVVLGGRDYPTTRGWNEIEHDEDTVTGSDAYTFLSCF